MKIKVEEVKKIDAGSGNRPIEGYVGVDLYNNKTDIKADVRDLPFIDNQLEEIVCNHVIEHLSFKETDLVLREFFRVLQSGGVLNIEVPDLEWVLKDWLSVEDDQRWGHRLERIFGQQTNDGDYHKTGFSQKRLQEKLVQAGFVNVSVVQQTVEFHDGVLQAVAYKP